MARRRYDTESLVGELKRERRNAILLSVLGIAILAFLVVYFTRLRGSGVPEVPASTPVSSASTAAPADAGVPTGHAAGKAVIVNEPEPPATPPPPPSAIVRVVLPKAGLLFIDGELVAKRAKEHEASLSPGKHKIGVKIGRKSVQVVLDAAGGKHYRVDLDPRKKKREVEVSD